MGVPTLPSPITPIAYPPALTGMLSLAKVIPDRAELRERLAHRASQVRLGQKAHLEKMESMGFLVPQGPRVQQVHLELQALREQLALVQMALTEIRESRGLLGRLDRLVWRGILALKALWVRLFMG